MTTTREYFEQIKTLADAGIAGLPLDPNQGVAVPAGGNLQAALDKGGLIVLEAGATFEGVFVARVPGTRLMGPSASLAGPSFGPALFVPPGAYDITISLKEARTTHDQAVIQLGINDATQTTRESVPHHIVLNGIQVPTHRGKRAFAINAANFTLLNCGCRDVWDPAGRDSQGIGILNTYGIGTVRGGVYEAGSENVLIGGDVTTILGVVPADITFEVVALTRPLAWKTDGVNRKVKNNFELKTGRNITLRHAVISGCFVQGQTGWGVMLTPRNGGTIQNLLIEDVTVEDVGGVCAMIGYDDSAWSPQMNGVILRRVIATNIHHGNGWGEGRFAQWQGSPKNVLIEECEFDGDSTAVYVNPGTIWETPISKRSSNITEGVVIRKNKMSVRPYGLMFNGFTNAKDWTLAFPGGVISDNTFWGAPGGAAAMRANLPSDNTVIG